MLTYKQPFTVFEGTQRLLCFLMASEGINEKVVSNINLNQIWKWSYCWPLQFVLRRRSSRGKLILSRNMSGVSLIYLGVVQHQLPDQLPPPKIVMGLGTSLHSMVAKQLIMVSTVWVSVAPAGLIVRMRKQWARKIQQTEHGATRVKIRWTVWVPAKVTIPASPTQNAAAAFWAETMIANRKSIIV